jgi:hypothetical protein
MRRAFSTGMRWAKRADVIPCVWILLGATIIVARRQRNTDPAASKESRHCCCSSTGPFNQLADCHIDFSKRNFSPGARSAGYDFMFPAVLHGRSTGRSAAWPPPRNGPVQRLLWAMSLGTATAQPGPSGWTPSASSSDNLEKGLHSLQPSTRVSTFLLFASQAAVSTARTDT